MKFNERLKMLRLENGLTQKQLATKLGVGRTTISEYENGNIVPKQDGLLAIAQILNVSVDYLIGVSNNPVATFPNESKTYEMDVDEVIVKTVKVLSMHLKSADKNFRIMYGDKELTPTQIDLVREQLRSALLMIDHISRTDV